MRTEQITTIEKPFAVYWSNDCGYGTDYYPSAEERGAAIADIRKTGTRAWSDTSNDD